MSRRSNWSLATAEKPCPICKHTDWCQTSADGAVQMCMRVGDGAFKTSDTASGSTAYFHWLIPPEETRKAREVTAEPTGELADIDIRHAVYSAFLSELQLRESHRRDLVRRKAPLPFTERGYKTIPSKPWNVVSKLREKFQDDVLLKVPGFVVKKNRKGEPYLTINAQPGMTVPVRDENGKIAAVKVRADKAVKDRKYTWLSSKRFGGPGPGTPAHCPLGVNGPVDVLRIAEAPLKADVAAALNCTPTIGADSATNWKSAVSLAKALGARTARLAWDKDSFTNSKVARGLSKCAAALQDDGIAVEIETWDTDHKGIDDLLAAGGMPKVISGEIASEFLAVLASKIGLDDDDDGRQEIEISADEHETNDAAVRALATDQELYQRGGELVWIIFGEQPDDGIKRPENAPHIAPLSLPSIRERLSRCAKFGICVPSEKEGEEPRFERKHVPDWCVKAVANRGQWKGIRPLAGVVTCPVLRPDGSILNVPGYDQATCLFFEPQGVEFQVPDHPTRGDAIVAAGRLLDLIQDFPFPETNPAHRSVWLAALLTSAARFAFIGPSPIFMADANTAGAGKTLLWEIISLILTGADFARMDNPENAIEANKVIVSLILAGDQLVLIDNIVGNFGNSAIDAAATGTSYKGRILCTNDMACARLPMTWFGSGNNVILVGDTRRRVCGLRLQSPEEKPEERTGFKYPNIAQHVRDYRPALLMDVLTILSAFCRAGKPQSKIKHWGSYEEWSKLIRQAIVWCDLPDPGETRQEVAARSDKDAEHLHGLIAGWEEIDADCTGLTAAGALDLLKSHPVKFDTLRDVLAEMFNCKPGELPGTRHLGNKLKHLRGRVCGGKAFDDRGQDRKGLNVWRVVTVDGEKSNAESAGSAGSHLLPRAGARTSCPPDPGKQKSSELGNKPEPAEPADPAGREVIHDKTGCNSGRWWDCTNGKRYCRDCKPPLHASVVVAEGCADA